MNVQELRLKLINLAWSEDKSISNIILDAKKLEDYIYGNNRFSVTEHNRPVSEPTPKRCGDKLVDRLRSELNKQDLSKFKTHGIEQGDKISC